MWDEIRGLCWTCVTLCWPWESWLCLSRDTTARKLASAHWRDNLMLHHRPRWTNPKGMPVGGLTLSPHPRGWLQGARTDQLSYYSGLQPGLGLAPSRTCWSWWRDWSCRMIPTTSPRLVAATGYPRRVLRGSSEDGVPDTRGLEPNLWLNTMNICQ